MRAPTLLVLLAGCPKPAPPPPEAAVVTPEAAEPMRTPATAPWPTTLPPPPARRGLGGATDLRALAASQEIFTVEAALPTLAGLDADRLARLRAALEADARWRVGRWQEDLVAWRRCRGADGAWAADWAGYCAEEGAQWRVMLVLTGAVQGDGVVQHQITGAQARHRPHPRAHRDRAGHARPRARGAARDPRAGARRLALGGRRAPGGPLRRARSGPRVLVPDRGPAGRGRGDRPLAAVGR